MAAKPPQKSPEWRIQAPDNSRMKLSPIPTVLNEGDSFIYSGWLINCSAAASPELSLTGRTS